MTADAAPRLLQVPRDNFLTRRWQYADGEHVSFIGPTQSGKTTLAFQLLEYSASQIRPAVILVMKPRDPVPGKWGRRLRMRQVRHWPPVRVLGLRPAGWLLWPRHTFDPERDDARLYVEFRRALLDSYKRGNRIVFGDEVYGLATELGLKRELRTLWTRGASMGTGLWTATQRPREIPLQAYSQAEHVFMAYTPDKMDRDRYSEIGGVDPDIVKWVTARLPKYHWLYVRRTGPAMCVIGP